MSTHCEIKFHNNPQGIYYAGQTLTGSAELHLEKPKKLREFVLKIVGIAEASWANKDKDDKKATCRGSEKLLQAVQILIRPKDSESDTVEMPAGTYVFNFACTLPATLPRSFEGRYGHIRYTVSAKIVRSWTLDQTSKATFTVRKPLDLNLTPESVRQPVRVEFTKRFYSWTCSSGRLQVAVDIPITGYVPGQIINVTIMLDNRSSVGVNCIVTNFLRVVTYTSSCGRTNVDTKSIASVENSVTDDRANRYNQHIVVPSVKPNIDCSVLKVTYELLVTIKVGSCRTNPRLRIPLTIGTVPLVAAPTTALPADETPNNGIFGAFFEPSATPVEEPEDTPNYAETMTTSLVNVNDDSNAI